MLKAGIVGLPNVGKSTLFNALTRAHKAETSNYPFCTIHPNIGVVAVPEPRLEVLAKIANVDTVIPPAIEFVDIAGLVKGASHGEGLGNKFLSHIREVDAIIHVVRCFEDPNIVHVSGGMDPVRDIETVLTELVLSDLEAVGKHHEKIARDAKRGDKTALAGEAVLKKLAPHLDTGQPAITLGVTAEERAVMKHFFLLSDKPTIFAANVADTELAGAEANPRVAQVRDYARTHHACETAVISAQIESDLADLPPAEAKDFLKDLGVIESGVSALIRTVYHLLGLRTFFTFNQKEAHGWTIQAGESAAKAAGRIHTDFERGFIKAETVAFEHLAQCGSVHHAREKGFYRVEGKDYVVQDGDVLLIKFNV